MLDEFILKHSKFMNQFYPISIYARGVKLIVTRGHISLSVVFKGPNAILGLYKCNYSLTRGKELGAATR